MSDQKPETPQDADATAPLSTSSTQHLPAHGRPPGPPGYRRPRIGPTPPAHGPRTDRHSGHRNPLRDARPVTLCGTAGSARVAATDAAAGDLPAAARRTELGLVVFGVIVGLVGAGVVANQVAGFQVSSLSELGPSVLVFAGLACALLGIVGILTRRRRG